MTKKQYELIPNWCIYENIDGVEKWLKLDEVCNLLNELYEEKEIAIDGIQIADELIKKYGSEELKHEWKKEVSVKYR